MRINRLALSALAIFLVVPAWAQSVQSYPWQAQQPRHWSPTAAMPVSSPLNQDATSVQDSGPANVNLSDDPLLQVPTAPRSADDPSPQPPLSVQSNALPESMNRRRNQFCNLGEELSLFGQTPGGLSVGGWIQFGYHNRSNIMFNNRSGNVNWHQGWLYLDRPATCCRPFGFRVDTLYGVDAQDMQAFGNPPTGNPDGWDNDLDHGSYGWAVPQAYIEYTNGTTTIRGGKFFGPFGYEGLPSIENFFYSRTYTRYYTEPFTMTGAIAEVQATDRAALVLGATAGWDTAFTNNQHGFNGIAGAKLQLGENINLFSNTAFGDMGLRGTGFLASTVMDVRLTERANYVAQFDFLDLSTGNVDEYSFINYLFYHVNPCIALGSRLEWWKSDQLFVDTKSTWGWTLGANYRPHANVVIRPEVRLDWGAGALDPNAGIVGIDAIMTF